MPATPVEVVRFLVRSSKRIAVSVVGGLLLVAGVACLVLPGPGFLLIVLAFAVLGTEYAWAAAGLERSKKIAGRAADLGRQGAAGAGRAAGAVATSITNRRSRRRR